MHFIYIYIVFLDISMPLLESMLLSLLLTPVEIGPSNASPGLQRKKERNGTNKKYDTRLDLNPGPLAIAPTLNQLIHSVSWYNLNLILISFTHLQITPPLSFFRVDFLNDIFLFVDSIFSMDVHS